MGNYQSLHYIQITKIFLFGRIQTSQTGDQLYSNTSSYSELWPHSSTPTISLPTYVYVATSM